MTPKAKAKELVHRYDLMQTYVEGFGLENAKECALIAVDEMIKEYQSMSDLKSIIYINNEITYVINKLVYWQEVKQEIEKL